MLRISIENSRGYTNIEENTWIFQGVDAKKNPGVTVNLCVNPVGEGVRSTSQKKKKMKGLNRGENFFF